MPGNEMSEGGDAVTFLEMTGFTSNALILLAH